MFSNKRVLRTENPELLLANANAEATTADGKIYRNSYVMLTRIRDVVVLEHVDA